MGAPENSVFEQLSDETPDLEARLGQLLGALRGIGGQRPNLPFLEAASAGLQRVSATAGPLAADCFFELAVACYHVGRADLALDAADNGVKFARDQNDRARLLRALNFSGAMSVSTLDYPGSLQKLAEASSLSTKLNDHQLKAKVTQNIGAAHHVSGQHGAAMEAYEYVRLIPASDEVVRHVQNQALSNIALAALQVRDVARGLAAIEEALASEESPTSPAAALSRVRLENTYVRLLIEVRQFEKARERALLAKDFASQFPSVLMAQSLAASAEAMADIAAGTRDIGLTRLKQALDQARFGPEGDLRDMLVAAVRGYQMAQQADVASIYLRELAELNGRVRLERLKLHQQRHMQRVEKEWSDRLQAVEHAQQRDLETQLLSTQLAQSYAAYLEAASVGAELYDDETGYHVYRVGSTVREMAKAKGLDHQACGLLEIGARQHDIGKIAIPESILNKPGRFTPAERSIMETHAAEGAKMIRAVGGNLPQMHVAEEIAHCHHERWDGTGYPRKLKGTQIPYSARYTAIADVYDALVHRRCYKEAWPMSKALAEIAAGRGTHFDPELTDIFLAIVPKLIREHGDLDSFLAAPGSQSGFIKDRAAINRAMRGEDGMSDDRR